MFARFDDLFLGMMIGLGAVFFWKVTGVFLP